MWFLGIPAAEKFCFCLNTLLSDIAVCCPEHKDEIILNQVETLNNVTNMIKASRESTTNTLPPITLCKATVPLLLGLARSMGRYAASEPPLLCRLFPRPDPPSIKKNVMPLLNERQSSLSHFRSIIPRSLSGNLSIDSAESKTPRHGPTITDRKNRNTLDRFYSIPYDPTTYFFSKFGSSFNQFPNMRFYETPEKKGRIYFPIQHLQTIFAIAKKLLTKEILEHLDEQAGDIYSLHQIKSYGYKSFSETINLVMVTLMRELLQNQTDLPTPFTKDVQEFVKRLFLIGQTELNNKQHDPHEKENGNQRTVIVNKYKLNVMANAACVDLLVWAIGDETGASFKCFYSKIFLIVIIYYFI